MWSSARDFATTTILEQREKKEPADCQNCLHFFSAE